MDKLHNRLSLGRVYTYGATARIRHLQRGSLDDTGKTLIWGFSGDAWVDSVLGGENLYPKVEGQVIMTHILDTVCVRAQI